MSCVPSSPKAPYCGGTRTREESQRASRDRSISNAERKRWARGHPASLSASPPEQLILGDKANGESRIAPCGVVGFRKSEIPQGDASNSSPPSLASLSSYLSAPRVASKSCSVKFPHPELFHRSCVAKISTLSSKWS